MSAGIITAGARRAPCVESARADEQARSIPDLLHVDAQRGDDRNPGTQERPLESLSAALARLPDPLSESVTIDLAGGKYVTTGGHGMPGDTLELMSRMRPGVSVRIIGRPDDRGHMPILAWEGGRALVDVREGDWWIEEVQVGSGTTRQRRGVMVAGPGHITLKNITFRTRSLSDAGIYAHRGGEVSLRGVIRLNEHLHEKAGDETFCGIIATDHGLVRFRERESAALDIGNGSLSASYYGCIRLGCETARITSWGRQSNNLAINNGGRIDLHNTTTTLCARDPRNTPIGLEHDGHILGEDAHIIIIGENHDAIALQKASTLTCNDIELRGKFKTTIWASSGSMFVGRFLTDITRVSATTSATINIEKIEGEILGPVEARRCGMISLPDRNVFSE
ncbi:MAG: hypothetical protein KKB50_02195 [Planctomycetes bacterium]|nr:hypothetical protein [Planctomycetota bacterium]